MVLTTAHTAYTLDTGIVLNVTWTCITIEISCVSLIILKSVVIASDTSPPLHDRYGKRNGVQYAKAQFWAWYDFALTWLFKGDCVLVG